MDVQEQTTISWTLYSVMAMLLAYITSLSGKVVQTMLYVNNAVFGPNATMAVMIEASYGGYSRQTIVGWNGPYYDAQNNAFVVASLQLFLGNGTTVSQSIVGAAIIAANGGTQATATSTYGGGTLTGVTVVSGGSGYEGNVIITVTGGGMTVAPVFSVVIVGGVITAINIISGGTFTSNPTLTIETPKSIIEGGPFPAPVPCGNINEPIAFVPELAVPPLTTT